MAWSANPVYPTSGSAITRAYAVANLIDPINWLRIMTGAADPPAADRVVISTSTTTTAWGQIPAAVLATGSVTDIKLALQKVQASTSIVSTFAGLLTTDKNGFHQVDPAADGPTGTGTWYCINIGANGTPNTFACQIAIAATNQNEIYLRDVISGTPGAWVKMWHSGNGGSSSGMDAGLLEGHAASFYATASALATEISNRAAADAAAAHVPSGLIAGFRNAADLTAAGAGWVAETNLDGRVMVGSGTAGGQTFLPANSYGTSWTATTAGTAAATTGGGAVQGGGSSSADPQGHTHVTSGTVLIVPMARGVAFGRKT